MSALDLLQYEFLQRTLVAALLVAVVCGVLGVYVVLRGLAMLGDGLAHVSFAGVALGLALGLYPLPLALGAAVAGALTIQALRSRDVVRADTAIGILFTAGLAIGILVVSRTRGFGVDVQAYLFGAILGVTTGDLLVIGTLVAVLLATFALLHRPLLYVTFSEEAARLSGLPVPLLNTLFTTLTAVTIVVAARVVGVLLVSALLVVPAASSLQWGRSFRGTLALAVGYGVASALAGVLGAAQYGTATGASIALASTGLFALTLAARRALPARQ